MNIRIVCGNCSHAFKSIKVYMKHSDRMAAENMPTKLLSQYECTNCKNKVIIEIDEIEYE